MGVLPKVLLITMLLAAYLPFRFPAQSQCNRYPNKHDGGKRMNTNQSILEILVLLGEVAMIVAQPQVHDPFSEFTSK